MLAFSINSPSYTLLLLYLLFIAIRIPKAKNAPGGKIIIKTGWKLALNKLTPKILPAPKIYLTDPRIVNAIENPKPIPNPSKKDSNTLLLYANDSALPKIKQLTTISGINNPKLAYNTGTKPSITIPIIVTNVALITIQEGILILLGIKFLIKESTTLDITNTAVVASPIAKPFIALVVTASVGHIPSN
jgi:hypothetical protein